QECGRRLASFVRRRKSAEYELQRRSIFELYIDEIAQSMKGLVGSNPEQVKKDFGKLANKFTGGEATDAVLKRDPRVEKEAQDKMAKPHLTATTKKLEGLAKSTLQLVKSGKNPLIEVPTRTLANVQFNEKKQIIELKGAKQKRYFFNVGQAK